jgi:DNA repair photolyase
MSKQRFDVLYTPSGKAGEYANNGYAANCYQFCPHGCVYCYVPACLYMTREQFRQPSVPKKDVLARLEKDLAKAGKLDEPIFLSFANDPYPPQEADLGITRRAIELIKSSGNNVRILTKGAILASRDFDLLGKGDEFGVTLTLNNAICSEIWEPGAPDCYARLRYLEYAHTIGIKTWASCEPVIFTEQTLDLIESSASFVDLFKVGILNYSNSLPEHLKAQLKPVDWAQFGRDVLALAERLGCNVILKQDLLKKMEANNG